MEFSVGDRVHVTRYCEEKVDIYGTVSYIGLKFFEINNCSDIEFENKLIAMQGSAFFGLDNEDYYNLVAEQEDAEPPIIQRVDYINKAIEEAEKYLKKAKQDNDILTQHQDDKECKVCEPSHGRRYVRLRKLKGFITDHYLDYTLRVGKGYKGAKFKKHKLMLLYRGKVCAHVNINYCPMCGRKLKSSEWLNEPT